MNRQNYAWILKVLVVTAYAFAISYNIRLLLYVKKEQKRKRIKFIQKRREAKKSPKVRSRSPKSNIEMSESAPSSYTPRSQGRNLPSTETPTGVTKALNNLIQEEESISAADNSMKSFNPSDL